MNLQSSGIKCSLEFADISAEYIAFNSGAEYSFQKAASNIQAQDAVFSRNVNTFPR
jgi:hypothetical protein